MLLVRLLVLYIIFLGVLGRWRWPSVERWASPLATDTKQTEYGPLRTRHVNRPRSLRGSYARDVNWARPLRGSQAGESKWRKPKPKTENRNWRPKEAKFSFFDFLEVLLRSRNILVSSGPL